MLKKITFFKTFSEVIRILPATFKKRFWGLLLLILVTGIVDLAGLASFIPIISIIAQPELLNGHGFLARLKNFSGIESYSTFVVSLFLVVFFLLALRLIFIVFSYRIQARFVFSLARHVGTATYQSYLASRFEHFFKKEKAKVIRELTISPLHFAKFLVMPLLQVTSEFIVLILIIAGIAYYNAEVFFLLLITIIPSAYLFQAAVKNKLRKLGKEEFEISPVLYANSTRGISGFIDVKLRNKESSLLQDYRNAFNVLSSINVNSSTYSIIPAKLFEWITIGGLLLIVVYGFFIREDVSLVLPLITLYAAAGYRIMPSLVRIVPSLMQLEQFQYLFKVYEHTLTSDTESIREHTDSLPFLSSIQLKDIEFAFQDQAHPLFSNLNFVIKKGEFLGVIGQSGSGKTTLVNLITGFLVPTKGDLIVDHTVISNSNKSAWWKKISYVQQHSYLEKGSLASNIAFLDTEFDPVRLKAAIQGACLTEFVGNRNPTELLIEEEGKNLSGGQKQRIIIARALYHQSELIVLDEATSALDNETEQAINETILNLRNTNLTVIIIAHRYSTLRHTDRIIKMRNGSIEEETNYAALLSGNS